jgi:hypothetical protein
LYGAPVIVGTFTLAAGASWRYRSGMREELLERGFVLAGGYATPQQCVALRNLYDDDALFRNRVVMERHAFGRGEYRYFARPVPAAVQTMRESLYAALAPIVNEWMSLMGTEKTFPPAHRQFLDECFRAEQTKPTALLLRYRAGDYNCLHQDLYGPVAFPLQATLYLSRSGDEFDGGEVVLTERRPRAQVRVHVLHPQQGDLLVFPSHAAPRRSERGVHRVYFKHGVSTVTRGERYALGIIFHEAQ